MKRLRRPPMPAVLLMIVALAIAATMVVALLSACGGHAGTAVKAKATSSTAQANEQAGKQAAGAVLPAKYQTPAGLTSLAFSQKDRQALAQQLNIPKATPAHPAIPGYPDNREAFTQALASAAYTAYKQGAFKNNRDPAQQAAHLKFISGTFPGLVKQYQ